MSSIRVRTHVDDFFEFGLHFPTKTLFIGSDLNYDFEESGVTADTATFALKGLWLLDRIKPDEPLKIILDSPGGDAYQGFAIYDAIKNCKSYVEIYVYGQACSAASYILQAGDSRIVSPLSRIMIHKGTFAIDAHSDIAKAWMEDEAVLVDQMVEIYYRRIREKYPRSKLYTKEKIKELLTIDKIYSAQEAVELGLADKILGEEE